MKTKNKVSVILILLISFWVPLSLLADTTYLKVKVFSHKNLHSINLIPTNGIYQVIHNKNTVTEISKNLAITVKVNGKKVSLQKLDGLIGNFDTLKIIPDCPEALLRVRYGKEERRFKDILIVYALNGELCIINQVELENFVAGAVLSEAGPGKSVEFYKIQCLISRTYAVRNMRKHESEKYHQCDQVHCQLYRGACTNKDVLDAQLETHGMVIVDSAGMLISAAFHSNSGGMTSNSEDVWSLQSTYLKSITDTFSCTMPMAKWEKKISKKEWLNYLKTKYKYPVNDSSKRNQAFFYKQNTRKKNFLDTIPLKNIRNDFKLKSTYFDIIPDGEMLIFKGKGYGHGVGLSQEGAINMVNKGYNFEEIIRFYYQNVSIAKFDTSMIPKKKK
jgi:stage II sporulation protein D